MTERADVLVIFGITGDLAKKMTLRSLYRLEARGLLNCPIVGVAAVMFSATESATRNGMPCRSATAVATSETEEWYEPSMATTWSSWPVASMAAPWRPGA